MSPSSLIKLLEKPTRKAHKNLHSQGTNKCTRQRSSIHSTHSFVHNVSRRQRFVILSSTFFELIFSILFSSAENKREFVSISIQNLNMLFNISLLLFSINNFSPFFQGFRVCLVILYSLFLSFLFLF